MPLIRRFLLFCVARSFPGSTVALFYYLLWFFTVPTQNVQPARMSTHTTVFLPIICCWQTLFGKSWVMDQTTSRSCFQGSIKKNSPHPPLLNSGVRWKRYRASAVCSAGRNPSANFFLQRGFGENIDFGPFFQF